MKLIHHEPLTLTPLTEHVSLHPGEGHRGLTSIIQDLGISTGLVKTYTRPLAPARSSAYPEHGYSWEDALATEFNRRQEVRAKGSLPELVTQEKLCVDRIHIVSDGVCRCKSCKVIHEYKWTMKAQPPSPAELLDHMWAWRMQTQAEAHVLGIYDVHFFVCWVGRWPDPQHYHFKYSRKECAGTWKILRQHRDLMDSRERTTV